MREERLTVPAAKNGLQITRLSSNCLAKAWENRKERSNRDETKYEDAKDDRNCVSRCVRRKLRPWRNQYKQDCCHCDCENDVVALRQCASDFPDQNMQSSRRACKQQ